MNTNIFSSKFEEASYKERLFFNHWLNLYKQFPKDKYSINQTPYTGNDLYDFFIQNKETYKSFIIEIKIRQSTYPEGYFYETSKHNNLTIAKNINPDNNTILYVNSTPDGTFIWNIDQIIHNYKPIHKEMNITTMTSTQNKINKSTYILKIEDAKYYPYHWDDKQFIKYIEQNNINEIKTHTKLKEDRCIFNGELNKLLKK